MTRLMNKEEFETMNLDLAESVSYADYISSIRNNVFAIESENYEFPVFLREDLIEAIEEGDSVATVSAEFLTATRREDVIVYESASDNALDYFRSHYHTSITEYDDSICVEEFNLCRCALDARGCIVGSEYITCSRACMTK